jgi:hypothetical protein
MHEGSQGPMHPAHAAPGWEDVALLRVIVQLMRVLVLLHWRPGNRHPGLDARPAERIYACDRPQPQRAGAANSAGPEACAFAPTAFEMGCSSLD